MAPGGRVSVTAAPPFWVTEALVGVFGPMRRKVDFVLPTNGEQSFHVWFKHGTPEGTEYFTLCEDSYGNTWFSPDGNWNRDLGVLHAPYDEAFRFLCRCGVAPLVHYAPRVPVLDVVGGPAMYGGTNHRDKYFPAYYFPLLTASREDAWRTYSLELERERQPNGDRT